jgi:hypothetical protein
MDIALLAWLAYPITYDFIPDDEATASEESMTALTPTSSINSDQIKSLVLSLMPSDPSSKEANAVTAVQTSPVNPSFNPDRIGSLVLSLLPSEQNPKEANAVTAVQGSPTEPSNPDQIISLMLSFMPSVPISDEENAITAIQTDPAEPTQIPATTSTTQAIEFSRPLRKYLPCVGLLKAACF